MALSYTPRRKLLAVVFWSLILAWGCSDGVIGRLRGSVELSCKYQPLPYPPDQITVYWQLEKLVVTTVLNGKVDTSTQNEKYKGRAHLNPLRVRDGDFTLNLTNLSFQDIDTYHCIIIWMPNSNIILNETIVHLNVTDGISPLDVANPISVQVVHGEEQTLTCSTPGGFRQPRIMWINSSDGSVLREGRIHIQQDGLNNNVTSTISINVTSSINITCIVMTEQGNVTAQTYKMDVTCASPQNKKQYGVLTIAIVVTLIILLVAGIVLIKRKIFSPNQMAKKV